MNASRLRTYLEPALAAGAAGALSVLSFRAAVEILVPEAPERAVLEVVAVLIAMVLGFAAALFVSWVRQGRIQAAHRAELEHLTTQLAGKAALFQAMLEGSPAGVFLVDSHRRIVAANGLANRIHGSNLPADGRCSDACASSDRDCAECETTAAFSSGAVAIRPRMRVLRTGESVRRGAYPVEDPLAGRCVVVVDQILTEQEKLQASLLHQEKMAAFGLLAAGIAHDMGNPLASIQMHLELLDDNELRGDAADSIRLVRQEVARLQRSLRELVDFARRRRNEAADVSVQAVVEDALRVIRYDRRMRNVEAIFEPDPNTPPVFMIEDHLVQVVLNLMINALDAMPDGGSLRIDLRPIGDQVALRVHDTGAGMTPEVLSRAFEPLFTTKALGKGTGLGLSVCRDIVRGVGGEVELHSAVGRGTTAVVALPRAHETSDRLQILADEAPPARKAVGMR